MGYFELKPFQYTTSDESLPRGATVTYFNAVAKKMGYEVEWVGPFPITRLFMYVGQGKATPKGVIDGVAVIIDSKEWREKLYFYPDEHYTQVQSSLFLRSDHALSEVTDIEDLAGYTIGFHCGVPLSPFFQHKKNYVLIDCMSGKSRIEKNLRKLLFGRIDAYYDLNEYTFLFEASLLNQRDRVKMLPLPEAPQKVFVGFSRSSPKGASLVKQYNAAVKALDLNYEDLLRDEMGTSAP